MTRKFLDYTIYYLTVCAPFILIYKPEFDISQFMIVYFLFFRPLIDGLFLTYLTKKSSWDFYIPFYSHTKYFRMFLGGKL
ncbi:hypothetical protein ACXR6G_14250 [Ancylomarina sp. YFZ004]